MSRFQRTTDEDYDKKHRSDTEVALEQALPELAAVLYGDEPGLDIVAVRIARRDDGSWLLVASVDCDGAWASNGAEATYSSGAAVCYAGGGSLLAALAKFEAQLVEGTVRLSPDKYAPQRKRPANKKPPKGSKPGRE